MFASQVPARPICLGERVPHHAPILRQVQDVEWIEEEAFWLFGVVGAGAATVVVVVEAIWVVTVIVESARVRARREKMEKMGEVFLCIFVGVDCVFSRCRASVRHLILLFLRS